LQKSFLSKKHIAAQFLENAAGATICCVALPRIHVADRLR